MKISHSQKFGMIALVFAFALTCSALPALAKNKAPKVPKEKYSIVQNAPNSPTFTVTSNRNKAKPVAIELDLYSSANVLQREYTWLDQTIAPGASQTYSLTDMYLTPGSAPYHVDLKVMKQDKKYPVIETLGSVGTYTVYH